MMMNHSVEKESGLKAVLLRNAFYRDGYRLVKMLFVVVLAINVILAGTILYQVANPAKPRYFAVTADGRLIKIYPLSQPVVTDNFVEQWTANAVRQTFMLDYLHWRAQLQTASSNYTSSGWHSFLTALKQSNDLKTLMHYKMVADVKLTAAPQVVRKSVVGGEYAWNVQMPLLITFSGPGKTINIPLQVTVIVLRQPVQNYPQRIAINNFIAQTVNPNVVSD